MGAVVTLPEKPTDESRSEWSESFVRNCYSEQRGGDDIMFFHATDGTCLAMLNGYAIIPIEKYFALNNEPLPERTAQALGLQSSVKSDT